MDKYLSLFAQLLIEMRDPGSDESEDDHYDGFLINEANKLTSIWPLIPPECQCGIKIPTGATCASLPPKPCAASLYWVGCYPPDYSFPDTHLYILVACHLSWVLSSLGMLCFLWGLELQSFSLKSCGIKSRWDYPTIVSYCCKPPGGGEETRFAWLDQ